jgi:hypothetical protein
MFGFAQKEWGHLAPASSALLKYSRRQNTCVYKILASTKCWHEQNVGTCAEASPYCFGQTESAATDFSQTSLMFPYISQKVLIPPRAVTKCAVALAALLLWMDSLTHCTGLLYRPAMQKMSQILASTKYRHLPRFH